MDIDPLIIVLAVAGFVAFVLALTSVKIVRPYERGLLERLGQYKSTLEPGLRFIIPAVDRIVRVDMREQVVDVPEQGVITSDNVVVAVDAVIYYEATDPRRLAYNVADFELAVTKLAQTNLRNVVGDMQLDQALTSRDTINTKLRTILDDATDKWGTRVVRVEIQRIDPPRDVVDAMHEQMKAERGRRAVVTEAQGDREAAITRAEGQKQSVILQAEGRKQQQILEAEGQAQAIERVAEAERVRRIKLAQGEAQAVRDVFGAIHEGDPTPDLISIRYLEALKVIADGRATKVFLPTEMSGLFGTVGGLAELLRHASDGEDGSARRRDRKPRGEEAQEEGGEG
jgi:regulator of protease activity HflC (stomatin/prohibitin superfamily)